MGDNWKDTSRNTENPPKKVGSPAPRKDKIFISKKARRSVRSSYGPGNYSKSGSNVSTNRFSVVESYKTLRTNLQFSMTKKGCNAIIITSTMPRDGKSTVAANTAVAFAQTDIKVLIIDCDMRKPRINKFFNIPAVPGLSNVLAGLCEAKESIHASEYKNLSIIPSGILPPNPAELLMSTAMEELMDALRLEYDLIILDTPPVNIVSDALAVTKVTDGVVLVVRHAVTSHPDVEKSIKSLEFVNAKILGIVLNAIDYSKIYGKRYGAYANGGKYGTYSKNEGYGGYGSHGSYGDNLEQPVLSNPSSPNAAVTGTAPRSAASNASTATGASRSDASNAPAAAAAAPRSDASLRSSGGNGSPRSTAGSVSPIIPERVD